MKKTWKAPEKKTPNAPVTATKEKVINVRCTEEQQALLKEVATKQGMGISTWLLHLGLADAQERQERARRP